MAAQPKKKTSKVRSKTRRAHQRATLPKLVLCPKCKTPKLPHTVCPECGYYGRAKIVITKLDKKIAKTLREKEVKPKNVKRSSAIKTKKTSKPKTTKKVIQTPKRTGEEYQEDKS